MVGSKIVCLYEGVILVVSTVLLEVDMPIDITVVVVVVCTVVFFFTKFCKISIVMNDYKYSSVLVPTIVFTYIQIEGEIFYNSLNESNPLVTCVQHTVRYIITAKTTVG